MVLTDHFTIECSQSITDQAVGVPKHLGFCIVIICDHLKFILFAYLHVSVNFDCWYPSIFKVAGIQWYLHFIKYHYYWYLTLKQEQYPEFQLFDY